MRILLVIAIPVIAFSLWVHHKRTENEARLGEVASAIAQRSVGVDCPGFWRQLVEVGSDDGRVHFDIAGVRDEAAAECYATQSVDFVAEQLGASAADAKIVGIWAARTSPKTHPAEYHSQECRSGGALDLEPGTAAWP